MSKWGIEEQETVDTIRSVNISGRVLNLAAGDGRFNNILLENASEVVAVDIDENELELLRKECIDKNSLVTITADITKKLPFDDNYFDGVFCTGTLHLFDMNTIEGILSEISRVLKLNGTIVLDFATDITRVDKNGKRVVFAGEGNYTTENAIQFFKKLKEFDIKIEVFKV